MVELTGFIRKSEVTLGRIKHFFVRDHICSYTLGKVLVYLLVQRGVNQSSLCTLFAAGTGIELFYFLF